MPDAERLTDERVREILERILLWEPSARLRGDVEVREIVAALDELLDRRLAARAGDREGREEVEALRARVAELEATAASVAESTGKNFVALMAMSYLRGLSRDGLADLFKEWHVPSQPALRVLDDTLSDPDGVTMRLHQRVVEGKHHSQQAASVALEALRLHLANGFRRALALDVHQMLDQLSKLDLKNLPSDEVRAAPGGETRKEGSDG